MSALIFQWIDLLWLPFGLAIVHRQHRIKTAGFVMACLLTLRLQVELMQSFGLPTGILGIFDGPVLYRGQIFYSIVIGLFLLMAYFSPRTDRIVFFAAALSIYILALCGSMLLMAL